MTMHTPMLVADVGAGQLAAPQRQHNLQACLLRSPRIQSLLRSEPSASMPIQCTHCSAAQSLALIPERDMLPRKDGLLNNMR